VLLLDTNVVSELRKIRAGRADAGVAAWAETADAAELYVSVITLMELELGVLRLERRDAAQGAVLRGWLRDHVLPEFAGRTVAVDEAVAIRAAGLHTPDPRPDRDAYIAASALVHSMRVVTRNTADFEPMGVAVLNPWERA
jgi:predicted nucleic acid-binding protein